MTGVRLAFLPVVREAETVAFLGAMPERSSASASAIAARFASCRLSESGT